MATTLVRHRLVTPDGVPVRGRRVFARLVAPAAWLADSTGEVIEVVTAVSGGDGWCELDLTPQSQIAGIDTYYKVWVDGQTTERYCVVPDAGPVQLANILVDPGSLTPLPLPPASVFVLATDPRLSDARTPKPHAASHATDGSDPVTPAAIGAIPVTDAGTFARPRGNRVTALGDSLTAGTPNARNDVTFPLGENYFQYATLYSGGQVIPLHNAGVGGETSTQILARLTTELALGPDVVLLLMGANDVISGTVNRATTRANIASAVAQCRAAGATPVLVTLPPTGTAGYRTGYAEINAWLRIWAPRNKVALVDVHRLLVDVADGRYAVGFDSGDGVHPTPAAMRVMGEAVATALASILPPHAALGGTYAGDPTNLLTNQLFLSDSNADGIPEGWSVLANSAAYTVNPLATDAAIGAGRVASITVNDTAFAQFNSTLSIGASIAIGDRLGFSVKIKNESTAVSEAYLNFAGAASSQRNLLRLGTPSAGSAYGEFVVPTGTTGINVRFKVTGIGTGRFAEPSLVNLTALGIA